MTSEASINPHKWRVRTLTLQENRASPKKFFFLKKKKLEAVKLILWVIIRNPETIQSKENYWPNRESKQRHTEMMRNSNPYFLHHEFS